MENEKNEEFKILSKDLELIKEELQKQEEIEEDCRDPEDIRDEQDEFKKIEKIIELENDKNKLLKIVSELRSENQKNYLETDILSNENSKLKKDNENLNKVLNEFQNSDKQTNLVNLISTVNSASNAFEKILDPKVKEAARGLALAAIGKLHMFIDKI